MEHKDNRQAPATIYPSNKQKDNQVNSILYPPEVAKKCEHSPFSGKCLVDGEVELIIQDGDDHVWHEGYHNEDF